MPRLLFDQNLSPRLVARLAGTFPGSSHVSFEALDHATDVEVWNFARSNSYVIVTKDSDFNDMSALKGSPPKVLWLRLGNCTTHDVEELLRNSLDEITSFVESEEASVQELM